MKSLSIKTILKIFAIVGILLLTLATLCLAKAAPPDLNTTFSAANSAYAKGQYQQAITLYQKITTQGYQSGPLYYNLGNAYYKTGATGQAVLYYEKARRLSPGDADLQANLTYALKNVNEGASTWQYRLWEQTVHSLTLEQRCGAASLCFFILAGLIVVLLLKPETLHKWKPWFQLGLTLSTICLIVFFTLAVCTGIDQSRIYAVAVKDGGTARFEPNPQATLHFTVPEGARLQILEHRSGWSLVGRRDGVRGWVNNEYLEVI
jgi:hypothetical protein